MNWNHEEDNLIWIAIENIQEGASIYSQIKRLGGNELKYRSWASICGRINKFRKILSENLMKR